MRPFDDEIKDAIKKKLIVVAQPTSGMTTQKGIVKSLKKEVTDNNLVEVTVCIGLIGDRDVSDCLFQVFDNARKAADFLKQ